jgi:hypothetical protein
MFIQTTINIQTSDSFVLQHLRAMSTYIQSHVCAFATQTATHKAKASSSQHMQNCPKEMQNVSVSGANTRLNRS